jgi:hypothetical protein
MKFKHYLTELYNIEAGQADERHEIPVGENSSSISNPKIRAEMNYRLMNELGNTHLSPESGIQAIRKVLHRFHFDLPALYDIDPESDELAIELDQFGKVFNYPETNQLEKGEQLSDDPQVHYIYILYYLSENGNYEFYAEIVDADTLDEILADTEDELEETE